MKAGKKRLLALLTVVLALGACSSLPSGPSVMALPGSGQTLNSFRSDDAWCREEALRLIGGKSAEQRANEAAVSSAAVGTAIGAVAGAALGGRDGAAVGAGVGLLAGGASGSEQARQSGYGSQRQYDQAYIQCMYAKGHRVPMAAETARSLQTQAQPVAGGYVQPPAPAMPPPPPTSAAKPPAPAGKATVSAQPPSAPRSAAELGIPPPPPGKPPAPPAPTRKPEGERQ
ncbi:YMGG-like glycine zipper-containing protein [Dechloromonas sp. ZY10]|uniref:YMGG-like glycine zipper-containing protein n=1 Tax=Dechloromonas aquae TaxID=2664436 RepID=UPI003528B797